MKEIDLDSTTLRLTSLVYGPSRGGKTRFAATWPRPIFLSDAVEGGYRTIASMAKRSPEMFFEPNWTPKVWAMESAADILQGIKRIAEIVKNDPTACLTGVIDSVTFLGDLLQDEFLTMYQAEIAKNPYALYDRLRLTLRHYMILAHKIPINWVWIALAKESERGSLGGPLIPGQTGTKMPAAVNLLLYQHAMQRNEDAPVYETRTRRYGMFAAGGRDEGMLQDPLSECSYRALAADLELDVDKTLPKAVGRVAAPIRQTLKRA